VAIAFRAARGFPILAALAISPLTLESARASLADQYVCGTGDLAYTVAVNPIDGLSGACKTRSPVSKGLNVR